MRPRWSELHTRTVFFVLNYVLLSATWVFGYGSVPLAGMLGSVASAFAVILGLACLVAAAAIHRGFPEVHSKARDFAQLRTTGMYGYVRHPFYSSLIGLNYMASLVFQSAWGILASTLLLPVWWYLARSEERDLEQEWGLAYVEYRRATPMFVPRFRRNRVREPEKAP